MLRIVSIFILFCFLIVPQSWAQNKRPSFIRDAEVEATLRFFATPIFEAAGLDPEAVAIHIVNDNSLNAFVMGGQNLFVNTGLLLKSKNPTQVIGVIAHEVGHIAGGHLARMEGAMKDASAEMLLATILGTAAAVAAGRADVGAAVVTGGLEMSGRSFLNFTRGQESAADQAATKYLDSAGISGKGLLEFMEILSGQELMISERQDPYVRTHPLGRDRVEFLREHVNRSPFSNATTSPEIDRRYKMMIAKLFGFVESQARTFGTYKEADKSPEARLARAVAYYRRANMEKALPLIEGLLQELPLDPYLHELKGQMLFENSRPRDALVSYREAVRLAPEEPLVLMSLAQVELELDEPELIPLARNRLLQAMNKERHNPGIWRMLSIAYGREGNQGMTALSMAQYSLMTGELSAARFHAGKALQLLKPNSPPWLQAQDIQAEVDRAMKKSQGRKW